MFRKSLIVLAAATVVLSSSVAFAQRGGARTVRVEAEVSRGLEGRDVREAVVESLRTSGRFEEAVIRRVSSGREVPDATARQIEEFLRTPEATARIRARATELAAVRARAGEGTTEHAREGLETIARERTGERRAEGTERTVEVSRADLDAARAEARGERPATTERTAPRRRGAETASRPTGEAGVMRTIERDLGGEAATAINSMSGHPEQAKVRSIARALARRVRSGQMEAGEARQLVVDAAEVARNRKLDGETGLTDAAARGCLDMDPQAVKNFADAYNGGRAEEVRAGEQGSDSFLRGLARRFAARFRGRDAEGRERAVEERDVNEETARACALKNAGCFLGGNAIQAACGRYAARTAAAAP